MIVTLGCPQPEITSKFLSKVLSSVALQSVVTQTDVSTSSNVPIVSLRHWQSHETRIHCVPSPFTRILAIQQRGTPECAMKKYNDFISGRTGGFKDSLQGWTTYLRHRGRIPLQYCYHSLPVLLDVQDIDMSSFDRSLPQPFVDGQLKEIAIPDPGRILLDTLECHPSISQSVTGVYRMPSSDDNHACFVRPLPIAVQDHQQPVPTLVFHRQEISCHADDISWAKIGYRGGLSSGQWISAVLQSNNLLDLRLCSSLQPPKSMFTEAQSSLLAGSLDVLQSNRVTDTTIQTTDIQTNKADCWIEFRAQAVEKLSGSKG